MASMNFDYVEEPRSQNAVIATTINHRKPIPTILTDSEEQLDESQLEPRKCRYNPAVLVGNWYDRRIDYQPPADDWITVYDSTYTCKKNPEFLNDRKMSEEHKTKAEGLGGEFLIEHHGRAFYDNYATTNDLLYRVLPLGLCGPRRRKYSSRKDAWLPENDLTKNFGNATSFGISDAFICEACGFSKKKPEPPTKRFVKPKGIFNEPILEHLDIDVKEPFRPHLKPPNK